MAGGVEQFVVGLANSLTQLEDEHSDEFFFLTYEGEDGWLRPYLKGSNRVLSCGGKPFAKTWRGHLKEAFPLAGPILRRLPPVPGLRRRGPSRSDGTIEASEINLMHFTNQNAFLTETPSIYQPHDLQHRHLPHLFSPREREFRDRSYRIHCERARFVVVMTQWGKDDLVREYRLTDEKIRVIPGAPVLPAYGHLSDSDRKKAMERLALPEKFLFYPAQTYPHKNHIGLLKALEIIKKESGLSLPLVCSGRTNEFYPEIRRWIEQLGLGQQVRMLGFVNEKELLTLYGAAHAMIFPSLFEGWAMPIFEAFLAGLPVACSTATSLPEVAGGAALLFHPDKPEGMVTAITRLWDDEELCQKLAQKGLARVAAFSWDQTAATFQALYREAVLNPD